MSVNHDTKIVEGYDKPDEKLKTDRDGYRISKNDADSARERILAKTKAKREAMKKEEFDLEEGMTMKDFKANRRKLKRREASADAKKRGHVGKEWYNSGRTYSPDEAKSGRAKMDDEERSTRKRSAIDPDAEDSDYSADKTKNPKKLRKQKAMGELGEKLIYEDEYRRMLAKERRAERESEKEFRTKGGIGDKKKGPKLSSTKKSSVAGKDYADSQMGSIKAHDKATKGKHTIGSPFTEDTILERGDYWHPDPEKDKKLGGPGANQRAREDRASVTKEDPKKLRKGESYREYAKRQGGSSTYKTTNASKTSKYMQGGSTARERLKALGADVPEKKREGFRDKIKRKLGLKNSFEMHGNAINEKDDPCWKGYTQVGMKNKNGREVPNCVPSKGVKKAKGYKKESYELKSFKQFCEGAAWTKKSGKSETGGLNEKGRRSYERENPGSDLKAPSKKVGNPRRASFCARMKGMRKRQKPSNNTGNDRLSKSLRAWNC